jgi:hypothetical protein
MPFGSSQWMYNSGADFYNGVATQSVRLDDGSSPYLSRTPSSAGNRQTWTISFWIKRSTISTNQGLWSTYNGTGTINTQSSFRATDDKLDFYDNDGSYQWNLVTTQVFRDTSAWYHLVYAVDTTQATPSDRVKLYVNGTQITAFDTETYPSLNFSGADWNNNVIQFIGKHSSNYFDGYIAEFNNIDGSQLDATSFGETKNGVWIPKAYTGSYGTNGFRLQFNQTGTGTGSSSTIGADTSGVIPANHFDSSGIDTEDCDMPDSPENNFATLNPLINGYGTDMTYSEGNLAGAWVSGYETTLGTILMTSGKWYWEITSNDWNNYSMMGIARDTALQTTINTTYGQTGVITYATQGAIYNQSTGASGSYTSFLASEIIGIALDLDSGTRTFKFYNNNTLQDTITLNSNFDGYGIIPSFTAGGNTDFRVNFGQDSSFAGLKTSGSAEASDGNGIGDFYYAPPSGYLALCTANLPEPTISPNADTQAENYFGVLTWSGDDNASRTIASGDTGVTGDIDFTPDFTWIKRRNGSSNGSDHLLLDIVRGVGSFNGLSSNGSEAEGFTEAGSTWSNFGDISDFATDGFTVQKGSDPSHTLEGINQTGGTYVGWNWKAGGTAVSNTDGSITSSVSANTDAGFSIVSYTGNVTAGATVGHGLGAVPKMIIVKSRDNATPWIVYHSANTSEPETEYLRLNEENATADFPTWNDTAPTSSVFSLGTTTWVNATSAMIAYCFTEIEGFSSINFYTGNGSTDGTFVYTGFRPAWVMVKDVGTADWDIQDTTRSPINPSKERIWANLPNGETTSTYDIDFLSNGFKLRSTNPDTNSLNGTKIYMAFAEVPFKYALGR